MFTKIAALAITCTLILSAAVIVAGALIGYGA